MCMYVHASIRLYILLLYVEKMKYVYLCAYVCIHMKIYTGIGVYTYAWLVTLSVFNTVPETHLPHKNLLKWMK